MLLHFSVPTQIVPLRSTLYNVSAPVFRAPKLSPPAASPSIYIRRLTEVNFCRCTENGYISRSTLHSIPSTNKFFGAKTTFYCICWISVKNICLYPMKHNKMSLCVLPPTCTGRVKVGYQTPFATWCINQLFLRNGGMQRLPFLHPDVIAQGGAGSRAFTGTRRVGGIQHFLCKLLARTKFSLKFSKLFLNSVTCIISELIYYVVPCQTPFYDTCKCMQNIKYISLLSF